MNRISRVLLTILFSAVIAAAQTADEGWPRIDKVNRLVTLSDFKVKKLSLPMAPDKATAFEAAFQARADKQVNVIALAVGKLCSARPIEAGCRINSGHAGSVRCVREILVRCEAVADCEDDEEKPRINRE